MNRNRDNQYGRWTPPATSAFEEEALKLLHRIVDLQEAMSRLGVLGMSTLDQIVASVAEQKTKVDGLKVFIQGLRDQIMASLPGLTAAQQAQIDQIFGGVAANTTAITDAMMVNTPPSA